MRNFLRPRSTPETAQLVAVERIGHVETFWGPFSSIDEVFEFCEATGAVVTVATMEPPRPRVMS